MDAAVKGIAAKGSYGFWAGGQRSSNGFGGPARVGVRVRLTHRLVTGNFCSLRVGLSAGFSVSRFSVLTRSTLTVEMGEMQNLTWF
ncbi:MAG: hypothetical protein NTV37_08525 [Proteobacteria bacterium]|nr:hypothetical protein [Pseudomonadota bacterium]